MPFQKLVACTVLASLCLLPAVAQQTYGEQKEAEKRAVFAQHQQADAQSAFTCLATAQAYNGLPRDRKSRISETEVTVNPMFWEAYLARLGAPAETFQAVNAQAEKMKQALMNAADDNMNRIAPQVSARLNQCAEAETMLEANRCSVGDAGDAPPPVLIPVALMPQVRICREMAANSSRQEPAPFVEEDPDQLADFNARIEGYKREVAYFDQLLSSQPAPQCPTDYKGGACLLMSCTEGVPAFGEAYDAVDQALAAFHGSVSGPGAWSNEAMIERSKNDRVQWSIACEDIKMVINYPEE